MAPVYPAPPLVEVLADFRFLPGEPWDIAVPGLLYDRIREEFPDREQHIAVNVRAEQDGLQQRIEIPQRIRFARPDDSALVQVGPDLLTVNHLKPYPTWAPFAELIRRVLGHYEDVARPEGLRRIGLRHINIVEFADERIELGDYFTYHPHVPDALPQLHGFFSVQTHLAYREGRDFLSLTVRSQERDPGEGGLGVVLDLDYVTPGEGVVPLTDVVGWLESAHAEIETAFEACITDRTRALFGADED